MNKAFWTGLVGITASFMLTSGVLAAGEMASEKGQQTDQQFLKKAARGSMAEVALGQIAVNKAESEAVRSFGQRMVTDHGKATQELKNLASTEDVTLPTEMGDEAKELQQKLSALSGAEFDRTYMREMLEDHKKDIAVFEKQAQQGQDPQVKEWAAKTLPTLREHLTLAQNTAQQVGVTVSETEEHSSAADTEATSKSSATQQMIEGHSTMHEMPEDE